MKTKLLLLFLFGMIMISNSQISISSLSSNKLEYKFDDLSTTNKNSQALQNIPYPIIFIHGLNSNSAVWVDLGTELINKGLSYGGRIDFCLNFDNNNSTSNINLYPETGADIASFTNPTTELTIGDFYFLNFDINNIGELFVSDDGIAFNDVLSNEASIVKQGIALKYAIQMVLQKTGRNKVVIMGHSMGGLCGREYIQNPSIWIEPNVNHRIAKLITTGTPHGGYTGTNVPLSGIDSSSEAYRDLRKEYTWSGSVGAYLYGGIENQTNIDNSGISDFYNVDVNCNGINGDNSLIVGLNQKNLPLTLDYAYIIGKCDNCFALQGNIEGDGIVRSVNADLNNFYTLPAPVNKFIYQANASNPLIGLHSDLPEAIPVSFQGLDEPNEYYISYDVNFANIYKGFITVQPEVGGYIYDYDDFKFSLNSSSQVSVSINNTFSNPIYARIINSNNLQVGQELTINNGSNNLNINLTAGLYYLEIYAIPTSTSYLYPYTFSISSTLSNPDFTADNSLIIYPNPTSSSVFFNNSIENFETATVFNYLGQVLGETRFSSFEVNQEVDLSSFATGVYLVKFSSSGKSITQKIIKE